MPARHPYSLKGVVEAAIASYTAAVARLRAELASAERGLAALRAMPTTGEPTPSRRPAAPTQAARTRGSRRCGRRQKAAVTTTKRPAARKKPARAPAGTPGWHAARDRVLEVLQAEGGAAGLSRADVAARAGVTVAVASWHLRQLRGREQVTQVGRGRYRATSTAQAPLSDETVAGVVAASSGVRLGEVAARVASTGAKADHLKAVQACLVRLIAAGKVSRVEGVYESRDRVEA